MVTTGGGDNHGVHGIAITNHLGEVESVDARCGRYRQHHGIHGSRFERTTVPDRRVPERGDTDHLDAGHQHRFLHIARRHHHGGEALPRGREHRGQHTVNRAQPTVKAELSEVDNTVDGVGPDRSGRGKRRNRDGEIKAGPVFG